MIDRDHTMFNPILTTIFIMILIMLIWSTVAEARDRHQVYRFRATHPCPATGKARGACKGWVVDHVVPLCAGGADAPGNMQWQSAWDAKRKDRLEMLQCRK
jgi:hypothetical protein